MFILSLVQTFYKWHSKYSLLQSLLTFYEELKLTYNFENYILEVSKPNNIKQLQQVLYRSKNFDIAKVLKRVINTLINYSPYISNTVQNSHLTNGPIERGTRKIKFI
ncbi:transposase [Staphylococcus agnetis]|uniref:transposase n=1 Tax=Staphylococcus agnetis TaxID=985762 RepID=UPI00338E6A89